MIQMGARLFLLGHSAAGFIHTQGCENVKTSSPPPPPPEPVYEVALQGYKAASYQDAETKPEHTSWEDCASACLLDASCVAWEWTPGCKHFDTEPYLQKIRGPASDTEPFFGWSKFENPTHVCP